jgi:hypothetical protein
MNWKHFMLLLCTSLFITGSLAAQDEEAPPEGWETGAGIGLDFTQLLQINPRQGAGQNRVGFGSATNFFANYRQGRTRWENLGSWQFGLQRLGSGIVAQGTQDSKIPFQKAIDELRLNSKYGYRVKPEGKLYYATLFSFLSQVTPTYQGIDEYPGNFVSDAFDTGLLRSKFFSPATIQLSIGLDYKPFESFSIYYSPLGAKFVTVADDAIAVLGVHGNPVERNAAGEVVSFENTDSQMGSTLRAGFTNAFLDDRISLSSNLLLFSNYLNNPQNIDLDWNNSFAYEIFKNFKLNLLVNLFYDDDMLMQITDFDAPGGVNGLGKRLSVTQQLLFTYSVVF